MNCRNVSLALVLCGLLAGCNTYYAARRDLGIDPVDPPPPVATAMARPAMAANGEAPGAGRQDIAQAAWVAERAAAMTSQDNTPPVGYKPPPAEAAAKPSPLAPAAAPIPVLAAAPAARPAAAAMPPALPPPAAAMPPALPPPAAGLPAGYRPSPSVVDHPPVAMAAAAPAQNGHAASAAAEMKDMPAAAAAGHEVWRAHLSSQRTEWAAIGEWEGLLKADPKLYGQFDPQVVWADIPNRGAFARLTVGPYPDRKAALDACAKLRSPRHYCAAIRD